MGYTEGNARFFLGTRSWIADKLDRVEDFDPAYAVARRILEWTVILDDF